MLSILYFPSSVLLKSRLPDRIHNAVWCVFEVRMLGKLYNFWVVALTAPCQSITPQTENSSLRNHSDVEAALVLGAGKFAPNLRRCTTRKHWKRSHSVASLSQRVKKKVLPPPSPLFFKDSRREPQPFTFIFISIHIFINMLISFIFHRHYIISAADNLAG